MQTYTQTLFSIFEREAEARISDEAEERSLIATVAAGEDHDGAAITALLLAYAPALRNGVRWYASVVRMRGDYFSESMAEEARSRAVEGLLKAIHAFNPEVHHRLAAIAAPYITDEVVTLAADDLGMSVHPRMLKRFFSYLRRAEGNVYTAIGLCGEEGSTLSKGAFLSILSAVRDVESYDAEVADGEPAWDTRPASVLWERDAIEDVEDRVLVGMVFEHRGDSEDLTDREAKVLRYRYGFEALSEDYGNRAISDAMVAAEIGTTRPTVQRDHAKALDKARTRLGA